MDRFANARPGGLLLSSLAAFPCSSQEEPHVVVHVLPDIPLSSFQEAISEDRGILLGGIGSDLWHGPTDAADELWMVTDRGPNGQVKVGEETRRTFPVPTFDPAILRVRAAGGSIHVLEAVPIVTPDGRPVTGLPNLATHDETPYDFAGRDKLAPDPDGLDPEGLVRTSTGEFWLADEYAPSLVHVDRSGKVLKRYVPAGLDYAGTHCPVAPALPAILARRKTNRGFEGLTLSRDEKTLYLALQSPLSNPDKKTGEASRNTRILAFDVAAEKVTAEYVYVLEEAGAFGEKTAPADLKISGLVALDARTLLVLERTDPVARLFTADLAGATNILGTAWDDARNAPGLEALTDLGARELVPLAKAPVLDLSHLDGHPDKIEGIAVLDPSTLALASDNDFDVGEFVDGRNEGAGSKSKLLVVKLGRPLAGSSR